MIIELEINGARVIISGDNLTVNVTDAQEPADLHGFLIPTGGRITALRKALGMNQGEFADHIGASPAAVCRWESGAREPRGSMAVRLSGLIARHIDGAAA